jgi:hypothetical protein
MEKFGGGGELGGLGGWGGYGGSDPHQRSVEARVSGKPEVARGIGKRPSERRKLSQDEGEAKAGKALGGDAEVPRERAGRRETITAELYGYQAARASLDIGEAAREALAETLAVPITDALILGIWLPEGGEEAAHIQDVADEACGVLKLVLDPEELASSLIDKAVERLTEHLLAASLGPLDR